MAFTKVTTAGIETSGTVTIQNINVTGVSTFQASSFWGDGDIAYFGDGQDLLIWHNSTDSIIRDNGTGDLFIEGGNRIKMTNPTGIETYAVFNQDDAVELWYDNSKKFETTGYGATVFGVLQTQGLQSSGISTLTTLRATSITGVSTAGITSVITGAGTTGAPTISPTGDSNTGIFFPSPDTIAFAEGGIEAARFDSNGRLGIGTNNAQSLLEVYGTSASTVSSVNGTGRYRGFEIFSSGTRTAYYQDDSTDNAVRLFTTRNNLIFATGDIERFRVTSNGSIGIGVTDPVGASSGESNTLHLNGTTAKLRVGPYYLTGGDRDFILLAADGQDTYIRSNNERFNFYNNSGDIRFHTGSGDPLRMTIASSGSVSIVGALSKGSGSFRIDHPLPGLSTTHQLVHSFIEGPRADLIYRGEVRLVSGIATIIMDEAVGLTTGTWELLCRDPDVFVTNNEDWSPVRANITSSGVLTIEANDIDCNAKVNWLVIAERQDAHMMSSETNWTDENGRPILEPLKESNL